MLGGGSITLFHVRGIRVGVDWSWFIVLFLVIFWLSSFYADVLGTDSTSGGAYALAVGSALGFFGSILLHELGHAFVAMRNGVGISSIQLWIFGGVARMDREADSPSTEFKIAVAGPLVTLAITVVLTAIGLAGAGYDGFRDAVELKSSADTPGVLAMVAWLAQINFLVLIFNLLPAFPMDGGRIARAIAWRRTGDRAAATRFAATLGQFFAYLFIAAGIFLVITGAVFAGVWLALIGMVINGSARAANVADGDLQPSRGHARGRRHGPRAGRDPRRRQRRAGAGRVLPALPLALVPGGGRGAALPRPARARPRRRRSRAAPRHRDRRRADGWPRTTRCTSPRTPRSTACSATRTCAGSAP